MSRHATTPLLIERQLGQGAESDTYQVKTTQGDAQSFAIKVFNSHHEAAYQREVNSYTYLKTMAMRHTFQPTFILKPQAFGELSHTHATQLRFAITMPIYGATLGQQLHKISDLKTHQHTQKKYQEDVYKLFFCLVGMLDNLHKAGIFNSDISPKNILATGNESSPWILIDFASAQLYKEFGAGKEITGAPLYQAPELNASNAVRTSSALAAMTWSMAQILCHVLGIPTTHSRNHHFPQIHAEHTRQFRLPQETNDTLQQKLAQSTKPWDFYTLMLHVVSAMENKQPENRPGMALLHLAVTEAARLKDTVSSRLEPELLEAEEEHEGYSDAVTHTKKHDLLAIEEVRAEPHFFASQSLPPPLPRWPKIDHGDLLDGTDLLRNDLKVEIEGMRFF